MGQVHYCPPCSVLGSRPDLGCRQGKSYLPFAQLKPTRNTSRRREPLPRIWFWGLWVCGRWTGQAVSGQAWGGSAFLLRAMQADLAGLPSFSEGRLRSRACPGPPSRGPRVHPGPDGGGAPMPCPEDHPHWGMTVPPSPSPPPGVHPGAPRPQHCRHGLMAFRGVCSPGRKANGCGSPPEPTDAG